MDQFFWTSRFTRYNKEVRYAKMTLIGGAVVYWNDIENFCFRLYKLAIIDGERMKEKLIEEYLLKSYWKEYLPHAHQDIL